MDGRISATRKIIGQPTVNNPFREIVETFDIAFDNTIYVETRDAGNYQITEFKLNPSVQAMRDWNNQGDKITFTVLTQDEVFVMTPTMFQLGWQCRHNRHSLKLFPAN